MAVQPLNGGTFDRARVRGRCESVMNFSGYRAWFAKVGRRRHCRLCVTCSKGPLADRQSFAMFPRSFVRSCARTHDLPSQQQQQQQRPDYFRDGIKLLRALHRRQATAKTMRQSSCKLHCTYIGQLRQVSLHRQHDIETKGSARARTLDHPGGRSGCGRVTSYSTATVKPRSSFLRLTSSTQRDCAVNEHRTDRTPIGK